MKPIDITHSEEIYTVSRLAREARLIIEGSFPTIWVEGEISNFMAALSGHWYFSLKDEHSQVRCAMFRPQNRRLPFLPKDGSHVFAKVRVTLYENRSDFQLLVEVLEERGIGKLQKEFEALKKRLAAEGWFDAAHKKNIPLFPRCVGVITSPQGAAIRDILHILKRRFPSLEVIIYPVLVQGEAATLQIVEGIRTACMRQECDVLILARGGGSLEDLWAFNTVGVAKAIYECAIPLISGIGHEIDFTIADFVADVRAPTPSAAAELVSPDACALSEQLLHKNQRIQYLFQEKIKNLYQFIGWLYKHLQQLHPEKRLAEKFQQLDFYELKLIRLQLKKINAYQNRLHALSLRFYKNTPREIILKGSHALTVKYKQLLHLIHKHIKEREQEIVRYSAELNLLSPLATLARGYAIAFSEKDKKVLHSAREVVTGDRVTLTLQEGSLKCIVEDSNC